MSYYIDVEPEGGLEHHRATKETIGHPSSILCHSANVSWRVGRQVTLDPKTELFINDPQANALRTRPEYRKPWELPTV